MAKFIRVYKKDEPGYERLQKAALKLTECSPRGYVYEVGECYFDFGQNWMWTTIIAKGEDRSYQALCPRDHENIILSETDEELDRVVHQVFADKYCPDRYRLI